MKPSLALALLFVIAPTMCAGPAGADCPFIKEALKNVAGGWQCLTAKVTANWATPNSSFMVVKDSNSKQAVAKMVFYDTPEAKANVDKEIKILESAKTKNNLIKFYGSADAKLQNKDIKIILTEYLVNSEGTDYIHAHRAQCSDANFVLTFFQKMIAAVKQLHSLGYVHTNLMLEKFAFDADNNLKLFDFGDAKEIGKKGKNTAHPSTTDTRILLDGLDVYDEKVDIFSLGNILHDITPVHTNFKENSVDAWKNIRKNYKIDIGGVQRSVGVLINKCLQKDAANRPTLAQLENLVAGELQEDADFPLAEELLVPLDSVPDISFYKGREVIVHQKPQINWDLLNNQRRSLRLTGSDLAASQLLI